MGHGEGSEAGSDRLEQPISRRSTEPFVENLEVFDIDIEERIRALGICRYEFSGFSHEHARIVQTCDGVDSFDVLSKGIAFHREAFVPIVRRFGDEAHEHRLVAGAALDRDNRLRRPLPSASHKLFAEPFLQRSARSGNPIDHCIEFPELDESIAVVGMDHVLDDVLEHRIERACGRRHDELSLFAVENLVAVLFDVDFEQFIVGGLLGKGEKQALAGFIDLLRGEQNAGAMAGPFCFQAENVEPSFEPLAVYDFLIEGFV